VLEWKGGKQNGKKLRENVKEWKYCNLVLAVFGIEYDK
jgi:hypothetical protein